MPRRLDQESLLLEHNSEDEEVSIRHVAFGGNDERNPRAWMRQKKLFSVGIIACMSILSPLAGSIYTQLFAT